MLFLEEKKCCRPYGDFIVELACGRARQIYKFCKVYVRACVRIWSGHNFYIYAWISK